MIETSEPFARLDAYIKRELSVLNAPGMSIGITDGEKLLRMETYGYANVAAQTPVRPDHLFEIGSISKAFTSVVILQLQEKGLLDVDAPVSSYLPWFQVRSGFEPITPGHLMSHTAGIIRGIDATIAAACETWSLCKMEASAPPGTFFHYSNSGYKILGLILEELLGMSIAEILNGYVLAPLGMGSTEPVITHETRKRLAEGYVPFYDDRPFPRGGLLAPATWLESDAADGSISSTASDICRFLRFLLNRGQGLLSEHSFNLLTQRLIPTEDDQEGDFYGYGLSIKDVDGHLCLGHSGGTVGYTADLMADMDAGIGVVVLTNGPSEPERITNYTLKLLRAAQIQKELPPIPQATDPNRVENASDYVGNYRCGDRTFSLCPQEGRLILEFEGERMPLEKQKPDHFYTDHPAFNYFPLRFGREQGLVTEAFHGPDCYLHERYIGPISFDHPPEWRTYTGHYRSHNPWFSNFRIVLRKGSLVFIYPWGEEEPLYPLGKATFRVGEDPRSPERIHFDLVINDKAMIANLSGGEYCRTFTP